MNLNYLCNFCYIKYRLSLKFERCYFCRGQKEDTCMAMTYAVDLHGHDRRQEMIVTFIYLLCNYSQKYHNKKILFSLKGLKSPFSMPLRMNHGHS